MAAMQWRRVYYFRRKTLFLSKQKKIYIQTFYSSLKLHISLQNLRNVNPFLQTDFFLPEEEEEEYNNNNVQLHLQKCCASSL